jgi:plasmid maintenance system antidote protein VapI
VFAILIMLLSCALLQVDLEAIGVTINELADTLGLPATELVECIRTRRSQTGHGR